MTQHSASLVFAALIVSATAVHAQPASPARPADVGAPPASTGPSRRAIRLGAGQDVARSRQVVRRLELQAQGGARRFERPAANEATETFSRSVRLPRGGTLDLQNVAGEIAVTGGGGDDIRIEAVTRVRPRVADQAQALLREMTIGITERGDRVEVRTQSARPRGWPGVVDFTVTVPSGANVVLRSVSGRLRVSRVNGDLSLQTVSGDIAASNVGGLRRIETVSGQIDIRDASGQDVTGGTVSGLVSIAGLEARGVELRSVSGDIRLRDATVERVLIRSVNGDIEYDGPLARNGRYELRSHAGDVRVAPRGGAGFDLDAATVSGDVRSDFELAVTGVGGARRGRGARGAGGRAGGMATRLLGTAANGGARLEVRSFSGDIVVAR